MNTQTCKAISEETSLGYKIIYYSGFLALLTFIATLSFLVTIPNTWKVVDGVLTTNFFLLKDIVFISVSLLVIEHNKKHA